jgi:hypothetical protein
MLSRMCAARWVRSLISLAVIQVMVDVPNEMGRSVKPWSGTYKHPACEPFRPVITIGRAVVWGYFVISVRATRRCTDINGDLRACGRRPDQQQGESRKGDT